MGRDLSFVQGGDGVLYAIWSETAYDESNIMAMSFTYDAVSDTDGNHKSIMGGFNKPVQLELPGGIYANGYTYTKNPVLAVDEDGYTMIALNNYQMNLENMTAFGHRLMLAKLKLGSSLDAAPLLHENLLADDSGIYISNELPKGGEEITVTASVVNKGLLPASKLRYEFFVNGSSAETQTIEKFPDTDKDFILLPGESHSQTFNWTVPANYATNGTPIVLRVDVYEDDFPDAASLTKTITPRGELLVRSSLFNPTKNIYIANPNDIPSYAGEIELENTGNLTLEDAVLNICKSGEDGDVLASVAIPTLASGETVNVVVEIDETCPNFDLSVFETQDGALLKYAPIMITANSGGNPVNLTCLDAPKLVLPDVTPRLSFDTDRITLTVGDAIAVPILQNKGVAQPLSDLTYTTGIGSSITVSADGIITANKVGTQTLTVSNGIDAYNAVVTLAVESGEQGGGNDSGSGAAEPSVPKTVSNATLNGRAVSVSENADGTLSLSLTADGIQTNAVDDKNLVIETDAEKGIHLTLPIEAVGDAALRVQTPFGTLVIPNSALQAMRDMYGDTLRLVITKGSFKVALLGADGKDLAFNDPENSLTIMLPYTLVNGQKPGAVVAVDKNNTILPFGVYKDGSITFKVEETGLYDVIYSKKSFTDVSGHWAIDYIDFVAARGLYSGNGQGLFTPDGTMTRAMFAQVLANLEGANLDGYINSRFADVPTGKWYTAAVEWAAEKGIVSGVGAGNFAPERNISREEMALMLVRYVSYAGHTLPESETAVFADESNISPWAFEAVKILQATSIINGKPNNRFDPQGTATRAEAVTIFARFLDLVAGQY